MTVRAFGSSDADAVVALWDECGLIRPWNDPREDIERKLTTQPELFLVIDVDGAVAATAMVGYDGHRGWAYYLAVALAHRGEGLAGILMSEAERLLTERGCPKIMLMVRADNAAVVELYEHLGYTVETTKVLGKRLIPDE